MILYGLKTCDTCARALRALSAAGHQVQLRDLRAAPLGPEEWAELRDRFGDSLVNRASTTWRGLSEAERAAALEDLLARFPALMKRPVIRAGGNFTLGWTNEVQALYFK